MYFNNGPPDQQILFKQNYDKELEHWVEERFSFLLKNLHYYRMAKGERAITVPELLAEIKGLVSPLRRLYVKYHENTVNIDKFNEYVRQEPRLPVLWTIESLEILETEFLQLIAIKHGFMDKIENKEPWEEKIKKKLQLRDMNEEESIYYATKDSDWKKIAWYISMNNVVRHGDASILLSAPNDGGKTNTALPILKEVNKCYLQFWIKQPKYQKTLVPYSEEFVQLHPEKAKERLGKFKIVNDVMITPTPAEIQQRVSIEQYRCLDINEPMEAATNLQSMQREVIQMGVKRYTTRMQHNTLIWEYQVAKRPTALMLEGMNFWINKMGLKWCVLSMASHLYRRTDPYYLTELDKCRSDREISRWFTKVNPNFIHKFKAPKMSVVMEEEFKTHYKQKQQEKQAAEGMKASSLAIYNNLIKQLWNECYDGRVSKVNLPRLLASQYHFSEGQIKRFMRDYDKFDTSQKILGRGLKEAITMQMAEGWGDEESN